MISMVANAKFIPGHILRPDPKGRYRKSFPLKSTPPICPSWMNLSGMNSSALSHVRGSRPIAQTLTSTVVPAGTLKLSTTSQSYKERCGMRSGAGGCKRSVSLIIAFR
jgi:hypothetical protein